MFHSDIVARLDRAGHAARDVGIELDGTSSRTPSPKRLRELAGWLECAAQDLRAAAAVKVVPVRPARVPRKVG